jgi:hypothetical protein
MFAKFPKTRPPLSSEYQRIYSLHYKSNRGGKTPVSYLSQKMEAWMHRQVAMDLKTLKKSNQATLELGAGTLNQLQYESDVVPYDIVEPFSELYESSVLLNRIRHKYEDISQVSGCNKYDRITSIATLEHICNLPEIVARSGLLLNERGTFRAAIPSEGTFLWRIGWLLTTGLEFQIKYGLKFEPFMKYEHVNTAEEIEDILKYFYENISCKVFGLSKSLSLYRFYACSNPSIDKCEKYLHNLRIK